MKAILTILVSAVITLGLRAFPFLVFRGDRQMPQMLKDLGNVLPAAILAVLVVYCLKDVTTASFNLVIPHSSTDALHERMVATVAKNVLTGFEGPLWRAIRGKGLSYDFSVY